jgi:hypothetical protein
MIDYIDMQEQREIAQMERIGAAMKDSRMAWRMLEFVQCMSRQGHPTARRIVVDVMTYEPVTAVDTKENDDDF